MENLFSFSLLTLPFLLSLSSLSSLSSSSSSSPFFSVPPSCGSLECPPYRVVHSVPGSYEIRLYNASVWMSTSPIDDISFVSATSNGFLQLFNYIQGKNQEQVEIPMTAPVLTGILPSDGPFCASTFSVRFYIPQEFQKNPPIGSELHVDRWSPQCIAVRSFGGFAKDDNVAEQAAELEASLYDSPWGGGISSRRGFSQSEELYIIAQYNSPFEISGRVNEVWLPIHSACLPEENA